MATPRRVPPRLHIAITILLLVVLGAGEYFLLHKATNTNPLVRRETQGDVDYPAIRDQVQNYLAQKQLSYSVFFEYLPAHISIKLDPDQIGHAASLFKLPTAMNLLRQSEIGNLSLNKQITLQQSELDSNFGNLYKEGAGYRLTLGQAARIMITDSDNTALHAVQANLPQNLPAEQNVSDFLDLPIADGSEISTEEYTDYLRCLYYSCFLTKPDSQKLLTWMANSRFPGIKDGVPAGITVADKIGSSQSSQSDCGIVYAPGNNYTLCIMLEGDDPNLQTYIGEVSRMVYRGVTGDTQTLSGS
jgi:beta-lactamase class A